MEYYRLEMLKYVVNNNSLTNDKQSKDEMVALFTLYELLFQLTMTIYR